MHKHFFNYKNRYSKFSSSVYVSIAKIFDSLKKICEVQLDFENCNNYYESNQIKNSAKNQLETSIMNNQTITNLSLTPKLL